MKLTAIAAIYRNVNNSNPTGFRVIDKETYSINDLTWMDLARSNAEIDNILIIGDQSIGINGDIDRLPKLDSNSNLVSYITPLTILYRIQGGFILTDFKGNVKLATEEETLEYARVYSLSNGKIIDRKDGKSFISAINGGFEYKELDITHSNIRNKEKPVFPYDYTIEMKNKLINKFQSKAELMGIDKLKLSIDPDGRIRLNGADNILSDIEIPPFVQVIGVRAFMGNKGVRRLELPFIEEIGSGAFNYCKELEYVNIETDIELCSTFTACHSLKEVNIPNIVKLGGSVFNECFSLESINMPNVKTIEENAFNACVNLKEIDLSRLERIGSCAFERSKRLEKINISNLKTIEYKTFAFCENLKHVQAPNVINVQTKAFEGCQSLTSIQLPKLKALAEMVFDRCTNLKEIITPLDLDITPIYFRETKLLDNYNKKNSIGKINWR